MLADDGIISWQVGEFDIVLTKLDKLVLGLSMLVNCRQNNTKASMF